jgi:hypothetical protein
MAATEKMQVQMKDGLAGATAVVEYRAIAGVKIALGGELRGNEQKSAQERLIAVLCVVESRKMPPGADENVCRRLGIDVFERKDVVIFVNELRGNFLGANFAEKTVRVHLLHS